MHKLHQFCPRVLNCYGLMTDVVNLEKFVHFSECAEFVFELPVHIFLTMLCTACCNKQYACSKLVADLSV